MSEVINHSQDLRVGTCRRHQWVDGICSRCERVRDAAVSRRSRNNRSRGNAIEREVCRQLGISRVGHHGGKADGGTSTDWITVQVKSGGAYPARIDALLRALPASTAQLRAVVHATADGPGHRRRALITLDLDEFVAWFGHDGGGL